MRFDEIWIGQDQLNMTAKLVQGTKGVNGEVVEIGAWQGLSTMTLANAIVPDMINVVDHWKGSSDIPKELSDRDNYGIFLQNMLEGTEGNFRVYEMDWREFVKDWAKPIRFLHLDAGHTIEEVADNLVALKPFAVKGGVFAGDDWNWGEVREGVLRVFPTEKVNTYIDKLWWVNF